jgi:SAM-dependent methyltransferase
VSSARTVAILAAAAAAAVVIAALRHRGGALDRRVPGGIVVANPGAYDALSHRLLFGSLLRPIAADVAAAAPAGGRVLDVRCGPGHLAIQLAREHGLEVIGLDLDSAMIERARANAERVGADDGGRPSFFVGDVASLPFPDGSFDVVVSTLSMHHWDDPSAGLAEIARVLRPGARSLIWDLRPGLLRFHLRAPDPIDIASGSPLRVMSAVPWKWPWRFRLIQRIELVSADAMPGLETP